MTECEFLAKCPAWRLNADIKFIWINNYCKGPKQERCARRRLAKAGKPVPDDLLPNNSRLD